MNKRLIAGMFVLVLAMATVLLVAGTPGNNPGKGYGHLQVVTYPTGLTGLFDTRSGILYVYDEKWEKCVYIRKLEKLGEPMSDLRDPEQE
jgi:hypothetical protein